MKTGFISKFFNALNITSKLVKTPNANNKSLTMLNGSIQEMTSGRNLRINGNAELGNVQHKSAFTGIIVINGNTKAINSSFESLEINGNAILENIEVTVGLHIHGHATLKACSTPMLKTYGEYTQVEEINSKISNKCKV